MTGGKTAVLAAATIDEVKKTPKRAIPRLAKHNDVDSMQKAKKRAAWKNLDFGGGNTSNFSFIHFPSVDISSRISDLGVSLGSTPSMVSDSINLLKEVELARSRPEPSTTDAFPKSDFLEEDDDDEIGNVTLSHLCGDVLEEIADDDIDHLSCDFRTVVKKIRLYL